MMSRDCKDTDREAIIREMLSEAGLTDAPLLRDSLDTLGSFASMPVPPPCPELAAMLAGAAGVDAASDSVAKYPDDEFGKRRQHKHRPAVIGAAVLTAMGLGIGGVAASNDGLGKGEAGFVQRLIADWAPGWTTAPPSLVLPVPHRDSPKVTNHPAPAAPTPAVPQPVAPVPVHVPAPADVPVPPAPVFPPVLDTAERPPAERPVAGGPVDTPASTPAVPANGPVPTNQGRASQLEKPRTAPAEPKTDSLNMLRQATDTLPTWADKGLRSGLKQTLRDGKDGKDGQPAKPTEAPPSPTLELSR